MFLLIKSYFKHFFYFTSLKEKRFFSLIPCTFLYRLVLGFCAGVISFKAFGQISQPVATVGKLVGEVLIWRNNVSTQAILGAPINEQDKIQTLKSSLVRIDFVDGTKHSLGPDSKLSLDNILVHFEEDRVSLVGVYELLEGKARFFFKPHQNKDFSKIKTSNAILGIRGTELVVKKHQAQRTDIIVLSGKVNAFNPAKPDKEVEIGAGQATALHKNQAPLPPISLSQKQQMLSSESLAIPQESEIALQNQIPFVESGIVIGGGFILLGHQSYIRNTHFSTAEPGAMGYFRLYFEDIGLSGLFQIVGQESRIHGFKFQSGSVGLGLPFLFAKRLNFLPFISGGLGKMSNLTNGQNSLNKTPESERNLNPRVREILGRSFPLVRYGASLDVVTLSFFSVSVQMTHSRFLQRERTKHNEMGLGLQLLFF